MPAAVLLFTAATAAAAALPRVVDRYCVAWAYPPGASALPAPPVGRASPPTGPYAGNGDVSLLISANGTRVGRNSHALDWQQWIYLSKNDMWGSDRVSYYPHLSAGRVGILVTPPVTSLPAQGRGGVAAAEAVPSPPPMGINASVQMFPGNASIVHVLSDPSGAATVAATTRVLENNAVVTTLTCSVGGGGERSGSGSGSAAAMCPLELLLSDTDGNHYGVKQSVGVAADGSLVWWRKENLHEALNPAYIGSCDPHLPLQSTERSFTVGVDGTVKLVNGSCLWADTGAPTSTAPSHIITSGDCSLPQGGWKWKGSATKGDIEHSASSKCLSSSLALGACGSAPWAQAPSGSSNSSHVYLSTTGGRSPGCLVVVPDNNNNTLGVAVGVTDATGSLLKGKATRVAANDTSAGITLSLSLKPGTEYTLLTGLQTLRDIGCAGIRPQWQRCTVSPQDAAASLVRSMATTAKRNAALAASTAFWAKFWAASSVDLTSGSASAPASVQAVERWYYLAQYLLGCTTRDGKVTSALNGFVVVEPVPWNDQFTLDYNLEATFWGAGSSNRLDFIHPVMASTTNPGAVATARLRAQNPGVWNRPAEWKQSVGTAVAGAVCKPACPNLTVSGFRGAEWPSAGMPLGDLRLAPSDLQTRFTGGLLATNLIQYFEYSRNLTVLREKIFPFVKDIATFYVSYAEKGQDGKLMFPYSCAQEGCACRDAGFVKVPTVPVPNSTLQCTDRTSPQMGTNGSRCPGANGWMLNHPCYECTPDIATGSPDGNHNAHPDVAFASYSLRNAVRFAKLLGVDSDMAAEWQGALDAMPAYPTERYTFIAGTKGDEFNASLGFLVEAEYGYREGVLPQGSTKVPKVWPWCNKEYPIANFAACAILLGPPRPRRKMWPTDEIGATQTKDLTLLARAKQTVFGLNKYQKKPWANVNGFCLSWPPAVRVSGREDAETLVSSFATAIASTTGHNGCVHNNGGMLENIGATVAINDLLLQSHGGRIRFFPAWNATALGAASFTTLRAYGAFLVSATIDGSGTVGPVSLESERGGDVVFESAWPGSAPKVASAAGATIPTTVASPGVYSFVSKAGEKYTISGN